MTTDRVILGSHAFFFRDGASFTIPSAGTAGRGAKPGPTDTGWVNLGILTEISAQHQREERDVFAPTPGALRLYDVKETKRLLSINLTTVDMSPLLFELLWGTLPLTDASTQANPLEGATKKGWLKLQQYKDDDSGFATIDVYVQLKISGEATMGDNLVGAQYEARVLHSTLNTIAIN